MQELPVWLRPHPSVGATPCQTVEQDSIPAACHARESAEVGLILDTNGNAQPVNRTTNSAPTLDALTRQRLGRHLQALYEPVIDEDLDPRLAELMRQLNDDRQADS